MARVFQRNGKGTWYIDYACNGQRIRERIGSSKKMAEQVLAKRVAAVAENKHLDIRRYKKVSFAELADKYLELHAKPNKRSWEKADACYLKKLMPYFGNKPLSDITSLDIEKYRAFRKEQVAIASVNRELALLKCMFNKAIEWELTDRNPLKTIKLFKESNCRTRYLTKEEIEKLLGNSSPKLRAIIIVALNTGMRKGEIQNLKWSDVNFADGYITLEHTKNGEKRFSPMNSAVREALGKIKRHRKSPFIFYGDDGLPYNFRKSFETALKHSAISNFRFHDLRHTFASQLVMAGTDLNTVRELLGHKSLDMTLRYSHLSKDHKTKAVEILNFGKSV